MKRFSTPFRHPKTLLCDAFLPLPEPNMNARDAGAYQPLVRLVELIERHEPLCRRAEESHALDPLQESIREFERRDQNGTIAGRTSPMLTASKEALRKLLWAHMNTV
jgi:hypothetical protein